VARNTEVTTLSNVDDAERRKRVRRSAIVLALIAAAFYFGFIIMAISRR
jgi:hypothetical protein